MRTDVKLGVVLGLAVLAVLGWYVLRTETPPAIQLADANVTDRGAARDGGPGAPLPPPLFNPPTERTRTVSPSVTDRRRPRAPDVTEIRPKPQAPGRVIAAKRPVRRPPKRRIASTKPTSTPPWSLARAEANRAISVDSLDSRAKGAVSKRRSPGADQVPKGGPPLVGPPGVDRAPKRKPSPERTSIFSDVKDKAKSDTPPKPKERFHVVKQYDTFAILAEKYYGSQGLAERLLKANPHVSDARRLKLGTRLRIPPLDELLGPSGSRAKRAPDKPASTKRKPESIERQPKEKFYIVRANDSFYAIARKVWGDGTRWRELHQLNKDICSNPNRLRPGMKLRLTPRKVQKKVKKDATGKKASTRP